MASGLEGSEKSTIGLGTTHNKTINKQTKERPQKGTHKNFLKQ